MTSIECTVAGHQAERRPLTCYLDRYVLPEYGSHVYILRDKDGSPVYVGQSDNPHQRIAHHEGKWWRPLVATIDLIRCEDRAASFRLERELIRDLDPPANIAGTSRDPLRRLRSAS